MGTYFKNVANYTDRIGNGAWVEIGIDRGEGSTKFLSDLAKQKGVKFYGVDADPEQVKRATQTLSENGKLPDHIELIHARGEEFLEDFKERNEQISMVYLDNFDWDYWLGGQEEPFVAGVKQRYQDVIGMPMTNMNSQVVHFLQAVRMMEMMTEESLVVCDDTWYMPNEGIFSGKCSAVIPYLLLNRFRVIHNQGYRQNSGAILGRFND